MKNFAFIVIVLMASYHCSEGGPPIGLEKGGQAPGPVAADQTSNKTHTTMPEGSASQKAYLDPETGELVSPPEHKGVDRTEPKAPAARVDSAEEIVEETSPVPGGGVMIDLKGRFHNSSTATDEKAGKSESDRKTSGNSE